MRPAMVEDFGPYRIVERIAVGGMAEIYLARQRSIEGLERVVVLKRILPSYVDNPEFVTMFLDEARLLAALSHPNIAQVFDLGKTDDSYYLVMEYVRGPTLGALLSAAARAGQRGLPEPAALAIALHVAEALSYVHSRRDEFGRPLEIVHRDLNPANVMVSYDGAVKLIDFGIAKAATKVYETRAGVIKGTYGYIAPEQLTRTAPVDHRADVFALGVLLYEMLLGQHPFDVSDEPSLIDRILNGSYERPRQVVSGFPKVLDRLIASCLSPHPEGRPDDVRTLIHSLTRYMASRKMVPTMGEVARLAHALVPDTEGPAPLKPLSASQSRRPFGSDPSRTRKLPSAGEDEPTKLEVMPNLADLLEREDMTIRLPNPNDDEDGGAERIIDPVSYPGARLGLRDDGELDRGATADLSGVHTNRLPPIPGESTDPGSPRYRVASGKRTAPGKPPRTARKVALFAASGLLVGGVGALAFVTARAIGERQATATASGHEPHRVVAAAPTEPEDAGPPDAAAEVVLNVLSEPAGATVSLDGVDTGQVTPATIPVTGGTRSVWVRVAMPGYITQEREVQATAGEARFVLTPLAPLDAGPAAEPAEDQAPRRPLPRRRRRRRRR